jgi:hypothetical protein
MLGKGGATVSPKDHGREGHDSGGEWVFPFEAELHAVVPGLHNSESAWLAQIDSLRAPDRKTHELIRMVCSVILRHGPGVSRYAMLAAEVGATWEEVVGSIMLTEPSFGLFSSVEALPFARRGWERGRRKSPDGAPRAAKSATQAGTKPVKASPKKQSAKKQTANNKQSAKTAKKPSAKR